MLQSLPEQARDKGGKDLLGSSSAEVQEKQDSPETSEEHSPDDGASAQSRTRGWLTRAESAQLLGVTIQTIKNYEKSRKLRPQLELRIDKKTGRKYEVTVHDPAQLLDARKIDKLENADTRDWYTRNDASETLSISIQTLKNYERRNVLHPRRVLRKDSRGHEQSVVVYNPKELAKLPRSVSRQFASRESGELAAQCFKMFDEGFRIKDVVTELRMHPDEVNEMREKWLDAGGASLTIGDTAKEALEKVIGPFADIPDLVARVTEKLKA